MISHWNTLWCYIDRVSQITDTGMTEVLLNYGCGRSYTARNDRCENMSHYRERLIFRHRVLFCRAVPTEIVVKNIHTLIDSPRPLVRVPIILVTYVFYRSQNGSLKHTDDTGMLRRVALGGTDVSEEPSAFIRVTRIGELGTTLGATSNRRTLPNVDVEYVHTPQETPMGLHRLLRGQVYF
jgi:hypothetical protein